MNTKLRTILGLTATIATIVLGAGTAMATTPSSAATGTRALAGAPAGLSATGCGTYSGRGCSPTSRRVDIDTPSFSNPTEITNPLFPISNLESVVFLGRVDGKPFRSETTLLPTRLTVYWAGQQIPVVVSQYMAFLDGRIDEIAIDRYAQADDGSVWYLGEDVFDYRNGAATITEGTWLAGRDGPAAMIMPGAPKVGDVFRPENVTGVVFEEVEVTSVDASVDGPHGRVSGALVARELHLDGSYSDKTFAPGYGEFRTGKGSEVEALALAVPVDAASGPLPQELSFITTSSWGILENVRLGDWDAAASTIKRVNAAWKRVAAGSPPRVANHLTRKLRAFTRAIEAQRGALVAQLAVEVAQPTLDLELRYRPAAEVDVERFHMWTQQLRVHAAAGDRAGVAGDVATLEWVRDRITGVLDSNALGQLDAGLVALRAAVDARNLRAATDHASRLGALVRRYARPATI